MTTDEPDAVDLMPLDTPVLKVSRPVAACVRCRGAKIKCDGKLPACTSCERTGRAAECTSTNDQFARGKERSYVLTLETKIDKLQAKLEEAQRRKPSVISIPDDETTVAPSRRPSATVDHTQPASRATRRKEALAIDDLVNNFGFLSVNATARDFYGFSTAMSYARLVIWASSREALPEGTTKALPQRHVTVRLLQQYLNSAHQLVPVMDEASIYGCINNLYHQDQSKAEPFDHWVVRLVLAVACASMSERSGDQSYLESIGHVCAALEHSEAVLHPGAISSVQGLVLLVEYALLDPHHFDAWSLIGAASRAMLDLGLHQDPPKGALMSKGKLATRRRVFWAVYSLDRSMSLVQSRAFSFSDDSAKVKDAFAKPSASNVTSPLEGPQEVPKSWLQSRDQAMDLVALRRIQSSWYTDLFQSGRTAWDEPYPYIWNVCSSMKSWFEKLSASTSPHLRTYFELELLYSYIYVLAPSPRVPTIIPYAQTLIFEYCIRYADILLGLLSETRPAAPINFNDAMRAYMTGHFFLDILKQNTEGLLSGQIPPRPEVRPSTAPPPAFPDNGYIADDQLPYINTVRAINCIKKLIECLARFGTRWGYSSWSSLFTSATASMVEDLTQRQRNFEMMAGVRRGSVWHGSHESGSSNGSISFQRSPHNSVSSQQSPYHPSTAATTPGMSVYHGSSPPAQISPPLHHQPQLWQTPPHGNAYPHQPVQVTMASQPTMMSYTDPSARQAFGTAPYQQFGTWGGYSGPAVPSTLDEENAVPPNAPWDQALR